MATHTVTGISIPKVLLEELDRVRGDVPRSRYITRLIEADLEGREEEVVA